LEFSINLRLLEALAFFESSSLSLIISPFTIRVGILMTFESTFTTLLSMRAVPKHSLKINKSLSKFALF
jgi:hypothetical protein